MAERPVKDYDKFVLRLPEGMRDAIADRAKRNGRSMNAEIVKILNEAIVIDDFEDLSSTQESLVESRNNGSKEEIISFSKQRLDEVIQSAAEDAAHEAINIILKHYNVEAKKKPT